METVITGSLKTGFKNCRFKLGDSSEFNGTNSLQTSTSATRTDSLRLISKTRPVISSASYGNVKLKIL